MARINTCLKRTFIGFNLFFAIIGAAIISLAVLSQILTNTEEKGLEGRGTGLIVLYIMGAITMLLSLLGAYGAHKEHKVSLIVFLVCMILGSLGMLRAGISTVIARPQLEDALEERFRDFLPLNSASFQVKDLADTLQTQMHCCGLFSYRDWNDDLPASCLCPLEEEQEYDCRRVSYTYLMGTKLIYGKPCFPILMYYVRLLSDIVIGILFTLGALAVFGTILSSIMIHQLRQVTRSPVVLTVPTIFTAGPPKYHELHNPPPPY